MLILAAILAIFIYGMIAAMLGTILPELSDRFKLTPSQNGTIASAQALGLILASLCTGPILDNEGKKLGMVLGLGLIAVALFVLPRVAGFFSVAFLLFLLGVGGGITVTAANALASDVGEAHRAMALTLANLFFGLGALATPFIAANLFGRNWVRLCYTIASLTVVTVVIEALTRMPGPTGSGRFVLTDVAPVLGHPLLFLTALFVFLYITCEVGMWNWLPRHLIAQGIPEARALNILVPGICIGNFDWAGRDLACPQSRACRYGHIVGIGGYGDNYFFIAANAISHRRRGIGLSSRPIDGTRLSQHARDCRRRFSSHDGNGDWFRNHVRMDWPRREFTRDRRDCRRRSAKAEESAAGDPGLCRYYGGPGSGNSECAALEPERDLLKSSCPKPSRRACSRRRSSALPSWACRTALAPQKYV